MGCIQSIQNDRVAIVERFGKFDRVAKPGLLCLPLPFIWCNAGEVSLRVQQLNVNVETKTKDNVFVVLVVAVQYEVLPDKVYEAFYKLTNPNVQINSFVFDCVRASVPKMEIDEIFVEKGYLAGTIKENLAALMEEYGYRIHETLVIDIEPDEKVKTAMNEINANRRLRIAAQEKAEADKIILVKRAEAEAESRFLQGEGIAKQRQALIEGLRDSIHDFSDNIEGMRSKDVMEVVLVTQYFDTLKEIGAGSSECTIFASHNPGALGGIAEQIRKGFMLTDS